MLPTNFRIINPVKDQYFIINIMKFRTWDINRTIFRLSTILTS